MITVKYLNYSQEKDKMIREFKFFHGITIQSEGIQGIIRTLRAQWTPGLADDDVVNSEQTLLDILASDIRNEIDEEVIRGVERLTRNWDGGNIA